MHACRDLHYLDVIKKPRRPLIIDPTVPVVTASGSGLRLTCEYQSMFAHTTHTPSSYLPIPHAPLLPEDAARTKITKSDPLQRNFDFNQPAHDQEGNRTASHRE